MVWDFVESISPSKIMPIIGPYFAPNNILPSGGADPQDWQYLEYSMPGALSRRMTNTRVCDPLWPVFGCKTSGEIGVHTDVVPLYELPPQYQADEEVESDETDDLRKTTDAGIKTLSEITGYPEDQVQIGAFFGGLAFIGIMTPFMAWMGEKFADE